MDLGIEECFWKGGGSENGWSVFAGGGRFLEITIMYFTSPLNL